MIQSLMKKEFEFNMNENFIEEQQVMDNREYFFKK